MANFNLGPISLRLYGGDNWTRAEVAFVTNRNGGMARRETAAHVGFKSEHLIDQFGKDNPADTFECPDTGTLFFGKIIQTPTGVYAITAKEVYSKALYERACKQGLAEAEQATASVNDPVDGQAKPQAKPQPKRTAKRKPATAGTAPAQSAD